MTAESVVQQEIRAASPLDGVWLMRNNVGACTDDTGRQIRFGLMNDSAKLNRYIKSSDLIGITPVTITQDMVGQIVGVFTAVEVKHSGWTPDHKFTARETAQNKFIETVVARGGFAGFAASVADYKKVIE